jgi:hypothetical protein
MTPGKKNKLTRLRYKVTPLLYRMFHHFLLAMKWKSYEKTLMLKNINPAQSNKSFHIRRKGKIDHFEELIIISQGE